MKYLNKRNGLVYETINPILIDMYDKDEQMERVEEPKAEKPEAPKPTRTRAKKVSK